jgi:hypothetical protein
VPNLIEILTPGNENPAIVIYSGASNMADLKWLSAVWFGYVGRGFKMYLLVKFGDDISSRFGDSDRNFENSRWRPAAILDFSEKKKK